MRRAIFTLAALAASASLSFAGTPADTDKDKDKPVVGRKAPEFQIDMPDGKPVLLSSFKGKVICLSFIFTTCGHCQRASQVYTKLYKEMEGQGLKMAGVAINEMAGMLVKDFIRDYKVSYPVGFSTMPAALHYLAIDPMKRWVVPQVVIIDRKGVIRYQTTWSGVGDEKFQDENGMRAIFKTLLAEPTVSAAPKKAPAKAPAATAAAKKPEGGSN